MKPAILATALAALTTLTADAALITWGAAQNITGDSDVSTNGTLVGAFNGSTDFGPATVTVNGVDFARLSIFNSTSSTFAISSPGSLINTNDRSTAAPFSSLSAPYQSLLAQNIFGSPSSTLTMSGLTIGDTYAFQWWSSFSGAFSTIGSFVGATTTATAGNAVTLDANLGDVEGGLGQYVIGTFVADATTQTVQFTGRINAGQLRNVTPAFEPEPETPAAVPEPGTALAGVMLAGLLGVRRRRGSRV